MTRVLQINSSIFGTAGESSRLADDYVSRLDERHGIELERHDLGETPLPHLDAERFNALVTPAGERTPAQQAIARQSDAMIEELEWAQRLVLAVPMYNLSIPSQLKSWFDHIARAGRTFRYTEQGPIGLLTDKSARVFISRGGVYDETADLETPYIRQFLALLGITDVEFIVAEGLAMGDRHRQAGLERATENTRQLLAAA